MASEAFATAAPSTLTAPVNVPVLPATVPSETFVPLVIALAVTVPEPVGPREAPVPTSIAAAVLVPPVIDEKAEPAELLGAQLVDVVPGLSEHVMLEVKLIIGSCGSADPANWTVW